MRRTRHTQALIGNGAVITRDAVDLGHPVAHGLASMGRRDGEWVGSTFEMAEDLADHRALRDNGDEPQRAALAQRTGDHPPDETLAPRAAPTSHRWRQDRRWRLDQQLQRHGPASSVADEAFQYSRRCGGCGLSGASDSPLFLTRVVSAASMDGRIPAAGGECSRPPNQVQ